KVQEETQGRICLLGDPRTGNCSLDFRESLRGVSGTDVFRLERGSLKWTYISDKLSVILTKTPGIHIQGTLESGHLRNITCSMPWACEWGMPPTFSWTRATLTALGPRTQISSMLTLTPQPQDHGARLTCQVAFPGAGLTVERTIWLNVSYAPLNVAISVFQGSSTVLKVQRNPSFLPILEGQALQLLHVADSNPPAQLSWFQGSPALHASPISNSGVLELPRVGTVEAGELTCHAQHLLSSLHSLTHTPDVQIPATLDSGSASTLTCSVPWVFGKMPSTFSWTPATIIALGPSTSLSSMLTLTPWPQPHLPGGLPWSWGDCEEARPDAPQNLTVAVVQGNGTATPCQIELGPGEHSQEPLTVLRPQRPGRPGPMVDVVMVAIGTAAVNRSIGTDAALYLPRRWPTNTMSCSTKLCASTVQSAST
ncbi:sialic acid-binding Ig-like lectin 6, partial [Dasypus novemcinctus]|uniref:sialic acid-binding Ig-like lectin 6 n=1 Tax=Dasypus novemcinctus TaxID=9361 RepID=UPI00062AA852